MTKVYVGYESSTHYSDYDSDDPWDRPDTQNTVYGWFATVGHDDNKGNTYNFHSADFDIDNIEPGIILHIVYVDYDTGDTFGHDSGQICILDAFTDFKKADKLVKAISGDYKNDPEYSSTGYITVSGKEYYTGAWKGYFESMNYCSIETVMISYNHGKY